MEIFSYWDDSDDAPPYQAELIALWHRSWTARGWTCRLLTDKALKKIHANPASGEKQLFCRPWVINFGLHADKSIKSLPEFTDANEIGWWSADLVEFDPSMSAAEIINCGRPI